jgi:membrane-anchored mycosin MYCP
LVRSKFPDLTAAQVVRRITATANGAARSPSNLVGAGSVDPVAALTWDVPQEIGADAAAVSQVAAPPPPPPDDPTPRTIAFAGAGALALVALATAAIAHRRKDTAS